MPLASRMFTVRTAALIVGGGALALIVGALALQYGAGLPACELCLWQRGPLVAAIIAAFTAAAAAELAPEAARGALMAAALLVLLSAGFGLYHSGVERHWWPGPARCTGAFRIPANTAALSANLQVHRCDTIAWSLFGLSLANYNVLISSGLAALAGALSRNRP